MISPNGRMSAANRKIATTTSVGPLILYFSIGGPSENTPTSATSATIKIDSPPRNLLVWAAESGPDPSRDGVTSSDIVPPLYPYAVRLRLPRDSATAFR